MIFRRKKGLYYTTVYVVNFPPSFYRKIYLNFLVWRDIHRMTSTTILRWLLQSLSYSQSLHPESLSKRSFKGLFPQIRKIHEGYFTNASLFVHPLRGDGRDQRDIRNNHMRPSCSPDASLYREAWVSGVRSWMKCSKWNREAWVSGVRNWMKCSKWNRK